MVVIGQWDTQDVDIQVVLVGLCAKYDFNIEAT